jgi:hypothetical protein
MWRNVIWKKFTDISEICAASIFTVGMEVAYSLEKSVNFY